jgi:hypothetical protein
MTTPEQSKPDVLAVLLDDIRRYGGGFFARWRTATQEFKRRLTGRPIVLEGVSKSSRKPDLLALLEDDIRQVYGALSGELNRVRGRRPNRHLRGAKEND